MQNKVNTLKMPQPVKCLFMQSMKSNRILNIKTVQRLQVSWPGSDNSWTSSWSVEGSSSNRQGGVAEQQPLTDVLNIVSVLNRKLTQ